MCFEWSGKKNVARKPGGAVNPPSSLLGSLENQGRSPWKTYDILYKTITFGKEYNFNYLFTTTY